MSLYSTPEWRTQLRQFLNRRDWNNTRWALELSQQPIISTCYLLLNEEGLSRWLNNSRDSKEYRGPKTRDDYMGIACAMLQIGVIGQVEARHWLLVQGLYPLPHEAVIFGDGLPDET